MTGIDTTQLTPERVTRPRVSRWRTRASGDARARAVALILLIVGAVIIMVPFFWMLSTALKDPSQVYAYPPVWIPDPIRPQNFRDAAELVPIWVFARNSATIIFFVMIGTLLSCSLAAYGFARLRAPGRNVIFMVLLATLMLPSTVTLVPTYIGFNSLGWVNTFLPLTVPAFFGSPFYIFLLRQFYLTIPRDLEESARLDGASSFRIWWNIILPLSKPPLATVAVFTFFATYNDFFGPLIYLNDRDKQTVAVALSYFTGSPDVGPQMQLLMAMATLAIVPSLLMFLFAQRYFVQSIVTSGIKG
ncbi:MAG TPA: carbohydrate ABC transporter permease [Thermomicrobiales bacterium]|jgi:multiple sugar transport system permease protein/sn-glycerol 3-phosphate transport system permease protein|nr:carbohydrate ABC transporter permease [Thermomicrobiales bacterium]